MRIICRYCGDNLVCSSCGAEAHYHERIYSDADITTEILQILEDQPCTKSELQRRVHGANHRVEQLLAKLIIDGRVVKVGRQLRLRGDDD